MKLNLFAAALVMVAGVSPIAIATPAAAQHHVIRERTVIRHTVRPMHRHRMVTRTVCTNRHGHRVCRTVRR